MVSRFDRITVLQSSNAMFIHAQHTQYMYFVLGINLYFQVLEGYGQTEGAAVCTLQLVGEGLTGMQRVLSCTARSMPRPHFYLQKVF